MELIVKFNNQEKWFKKLPSLSKWTTNLLNIMRQACGNEDYYTLEMQRDGQNITLYLKPKK